MPTNQDQLRSALADRYLIEREIGRGGMATVYLAQDRKHRRPVAVKILHVACAYAQLGLPDKALDCLEKSALNGAGHRAWIENDPDLNAIRDHPRFQEFLNKT